MNTVESLKELYVKCGGTAADVADISTIPEMIDALTEIVEISESGNTITVNGERIVVS